MDHEANCRETAIAGTASVYRRVAKKVLDFDCVVMIVLLSQERRSWNPFIISS